MQAPSDFTAAAALRWGQIGDRHMVRDGAEILRVLDVIETTRTGGTR